MLLAYFLCFFFFFFFFFVFFVVVALIKVVYLCLPMFNYVDSERRHEASVLISSSVGWESAILQLPGSCVGMYWLHSASGFFFLFHWVVEPQPVKAIFDGINTWCTYNSLR